MRIDAHHHFWDPAARIYPWMEGDVLDPIRRAYTPADMAPELKKSGIDGTVLVQTTSTEEETLEFLELAEATDFVHGVVGWVDLTDDDVGSRLDAMRSAPGGRWLVGIRHQVHDEPDPRWLCSPSVRRGLTAIQNLGLTYDLLLRARELPAAIETVQALPELAFVVDHISKPTIATGSDADWEAGMTELAKLPNVSVKLSGMVTEADWQNWTFEDLRPFVAIVVDLFGTERLMFGSDWPVCLLAVSEYSDVVEATRAALGGDPSPSEAEAVFGANANAFYKLSGQHAGVES